MLFKMPWPRPISYANRYARRVSEEHLKAVQKQREFAIRVVQRMQTTIQNRIVVPALNERQEPRLPLALKVITRLPWLRDLPARMIAFGICRPRLSAALRQPRPQSGRWVSETRSA